MADDSNDQSKYQVYLNEREFLSFASDYERSFLKNVTPNMMLLYAKAYFMKEKYDQCIRLLEKIDKSYSTKILYQRQALLFKATYLTEPSNIANLEKIVTDYHNYKNRCPGKRLTEFHHSSIQDMMKFAVKGAEMARDFSQKDKEQLKIKMKAEEKRTKYQGLPSYLITVAWNKKFNNFLLRNGPFPGPICNFELINHMFQLQPHQQPGKQYMDILMFPATQQDKYYSLSRRHWLILEKIFYGYPVKRYFTINPKNKQLSAGDNLVKTVIEHNNERYIFQWQLGTFWEKSVLPVLNQKFGFGQLKQQTRNKDFLVIQPGRIEQVYNSLKYVSVDTSCVRAQTDKEELRKRKILSSYDIEKYSPDSRERKNTVGLVNLGNTCYMNSGLQFLTNLKAFSDYFLTNKHLSKINISETNKDGSFGFVTCAYGDIVKRLWFSHKDTRYIDPTMFKRTFGERFSNFEGYDQEDAQQFLMFFLNCIHEDLNENAQMNLMHRQSMGGKGFDTVRNIAISHYNKHNKSIVSQLFHGFRYEEMKCDNCKFTSFRFQPELMLHVQAPPVAPKIAAYIVEAKNLTQAKKIDIYTAKLSKVEQAIKSIREQFALDERNTFIPFLYFEDEKDWEIVENDKDIKYIARAISRDGFFFIFETKKPEPDEEIGMISYYTESISKIQNDGFPRFLPIKKSYSQSEYYLDLVDLIFQTIPRAKIHKDRKQYIKEIKIKKTKNKNYQINYRVYMNLKIANFTNINVDRALGENDADDGINLESCLDRLSRQEVIDQWKCQKCNQQRSGCKTDRIYSVSRYIIIQIKRFTENGKISTRIQYPINALNMKPYVQQQKNNMRKQLLYNLQAVILHRGSLNSGHYTCICKNLDRTGWNCYDDDSVREIDEKDVVDSNAYILIYERADEDSIISIQ